MSFPEAKEVSRTDHLCRGLEAGIEGGIHVIRLIWKQHSQEESWGFLLIDAHNTFNEDNQNTMLWVVQHYGPVARILLSTVATTGPLW